MSSFANFAKSTVARGYGATDATILLSESGADLFPSPPFNATWWDADSHPDPSDDPLVEIVTVTQVNGDYFSIIRGAEGTAASAKNAAGKTYCIAQTITARTLTQLLERPLVTDFGIANSSAYFRHQTTSKYHEWFLEQDGPARVLSIDDTPQNNVTIYQIDTGSLYGNAAALNGTLYLKNITTGLYHEIFLDDEGGEPTIFSSDEAYSTITVTSYPTNAFTGNFTIVNGHAYLKHRDSGLYHEIFLKTTGSANVIEISSETYS